MSSYYNDCLINKKQLYLNISGRNSKKLFNSNPNQIEDLPSPRPFFSITHLDTSSYLFPPLFVVVVGIDNANDKKEKKTGGKKKEEKNKTKKKERSFPIHSPINKKSISYTYTQCLYLRALFSPPDICQIENKRKEFFFSFFFFFFF